MKAYRMAGFGLALLLTGCASEEQASATATAEAKKHCEAEGKQFIFKDRKTVNSDSVFNKAVMVTGDCVGPGDPGYVPPAKP